MKLFTTLIALLSLAVTGCNLTAEQATKPIPSPEPIPLSLPDIECTFPNGRACAPQEWNCTCFCSENQQPPGPKVCPYPGRWECKTYEGDKCSKDKPRECLCRCLGVEGPREEGPAEGCHSLRLICRGDGGEICEPASNDPDTPGLVDDCKCTCE